MIFLYNLHNTMQMTYLSQYTDTNTQQTTSENLFMQMVHLTQEMEKAATDLKGQYILMISKRWAILSIFRSKEKQDDWVHENVDQLEEFYNKNASKIESYGAGVTQGV